MDRGKKYKKSENKKKPKLHINDLKINRRKDEQAATLETTKKTLGTFRRISNYSSGWKSSHNKNVLKPAMLAVISALVIGSLFGVILLRMFVTMDGSPDLSGNTNPAVISTDESEEENNEDSSAQEAQTVTLDSVSAYVLQAGVFSEKENAETWAVNYEKENIPTMIWHREGQYFLFAGLAYTAEEAAQTAEKLASEELELYSKEWNTSSVELLVTASEEEWINSYLDWWNQAGSSSAPEEKSNQLKQLIESFPDETDQLRPLYDKLAEINEINDKTLLELWFIYETLHE